MAILVGSVEVEVVPNAKRFARTIRRELIPDAAKLGEEIGAAIGKPITQRVKDAIGDGLKGAGDPTRQGAKTGNDFGGAFATAVQTRIRAALRNLPTPEIGVATTAAEQEIRDLRDSLDALTGKQIGIDIDAGAAMAEIERIQAELTRVAKEHPDVRVRVDSAAALAQLAALQAEISKLDGQGINVEADVDAGGRGASGLNTLVGRMQALALAGVALGPAIVPAVAGAIAAIGAIGPAAIAAAAGVGVLALAFSGISDAVTATHDAAVAAAQDAATAAKAQTAAADAVASAQAAVTSATASMANAVANANGAAARSAQAVADAQRAVGDAAIQAARNNAAASAAYVAAQRQVADATRDVTRAQADLTDARRTAQRQLEDLAAAQKQGALDERQGALDVEEARRRLNETRLDPNADPEALRQAQLTYEQTVTRLDDIRRRNARVADDKRAADKKGVDGSDAVTAAQDRVKAALQAQTDSQAKLALAAQHVSDVQVKGARAVADAQDRVTTALAAQVDQARQSAFAIGQAQASIANAQRSLTSAQSGLLDAQTVTSAAAKKAADSLAKLSPAGVAFVGFLNTKIRPAITNVRDAAQQGLLPGVQKGLENLLPVMPAVADFVGKLAKAMGDLFARAGEALTDPFWVAFGRDVAGAAGPAIGQFADIIGNLARAFGSLIKAFLPFSLTFGAGLEDLTGKFANWSASLAESDGFQKFIDYVVTNGPPLLEMLGSLVGALIHIVAAAAPLAVVVTPVLKAIGDIIRVIPTWVLTTLIGIIGAFAIELGIATAATKLSTFWSDKLALSLVGQAVKWTALKVGALAWAAAQGIVTLATEAWTLAQVELNIAMFANPVGLVVLAIVALIAIIVLIVKHFDFFKKAALTVWNFFKDHWKELLPIILGPFGIAVGLIVKYWDQIKAGAKAAWDFIVGGFKKFGEFFIVTLPGYLNGSELWQGIVNGFKSAINAIIDLWNRFDLKIGGGSFAGVSIPQIDLMPNIPLLAKGGLVTRPTIAMVGEAGPELVVPLKDSALLAKLLGNASATTAAGTGTGAGGQPITINQVINNPAPERATTSAPVALRRAAYALGAM